MKRLSFFRSYQLLFGALALAIPWTFGVLTGGFVQAEALFRAVAQERPFGEMVGLNVKFSQGEPQSALSLLKELKVRWVRDSVGWRQMEPSAGNYVAFPSAFQQRLAFYKENHIGVVFGLWYDNPVAYPSDSLNVEAYGNYAREIAKRLKAFGIEFVLELWNEPHNFVIRPKLGGDWVGNPPSPWVDRYVAMVYSAVSKVKAFDPSVKLLDCDDMWAIHYSFLDKGLPTNLDGLAFHPYVNDVPEKTAVMYRTNWVPYQLVDQDQKFRSAARRLREHAVLRMGRTPELWITEWGWPVGGKMGNGTISEDMVAAFLPRAFITAAAAGVRTLCWFSSQDSVDGPMGLRSNDGRQRKAFGAFRTMTEQIGAARLVGQLSGGDHLTSGVQAYLFRGDEGRNKLVAWNIDGEIALLLGNIPNVNDIQAIDVNGQSVAVSLAEDGRPKLSVSPAPIYISGLPAGVSPDLAEPATKNAPEVPE
jgi:hypothetical protein